MSSFLYKFGEIMTFTPRQETELNERLELLYEEVRVEADHLIKSGAVTGKTNVRDILRVALENVAERFPKGKDYVNLKQI